jgi:hypothetical protein
MPQHIDVGSPDRALIVAAPNLLEIEIAYKASRLGNT